MRVAWVVHYPWFSGPHNRIARAAPYLAQRNIEVVAVLPDEPGSAASRLRDSGVQVWQVPLARLRLTPDPRIHVGTAVSLRADVKRLRGLLRRLDADALVVGGLVNMQGPMAAHLEDIAVVWQLIDSRLPKVATALCMPVVRQLADYVIFGGEALVDMHVGSRSLRQPSGVISPGVDVQRFRPSTTARQEVRQSLGWTGPDTRIVGTIANINPQKGLEYFARAAAAIYRERPNTRFLVVGARYPTHETYFRDVEKEIAASGIPAEHFRLVGARADVHRWYSAMDLKLVTSVPRSEGTTTTAMEALACGVPVVATDVGAVSEVVHDRVTGRLVPARDAEALAHAALELLAEESLRRDLGRNGRRLVEARYSSARMAELQHQALTEAQRHRKDRGRRPPFPPH